MPEAGSLVYREEVLNAKSIRKHRREVDSKDKAESPELLAADGGHFWLHHGAHKRCAFCTARASRKNLEQKKRETCTRDLGKLGEVVSKAQETQHFLHWSIHQRSGLRVLSCIRCDAYATLAPKLLLEACKPKVKKANWERLSAGKFPTNKYGNTVCLSKPFPAVVPERVSTHSQANENR